MTVIADQPVTAAADDPERDGIQRRTLRLLFTTQIVGGVGNTIGISVGALLAARLGGVGVSGLGQSCVVVGAALLAVPVSRLAARGRYSPTRSARWARSSWSPPRRPGAGRRWSPTSPRYSGGRPCRA